MSDKTLARRTDAQVFFDGTDITKDIRPFLLDITYTDNEEDETDDLQINLADRDDIWLCKWLNTAIYAAVELQSGSVTEAYTVTASSGVNVRSGEGTGYAKLGNLAYGSTVPVISLNGSWAKISYSGGIGYVHTDYIKKAGAALDKWEIGDDVIVSGRPQYTSYGEGTPGANVTNYNGKVTYLNLSAPYPICVGYLGWFALSQVSKAGSAAASSEPGTASKGLSIQAAFVRQNWNGDGKDSLLECGQFELDGVTASGPPAKITIKGTALPYSSTIRQIAKSKSWENYTLKGILTEIASKNGMTFLFSGGSNPFYNRVEQYKQSDIQFLKKLCNDAGCSLKVSNNILIIFDQATYEKKKAIFTIDKKEYKDQRYSLKTEKNNTYTSCEVRWTTASGKRISGTAYIEDYKEDSEKNQCLRITQKVSSVAEAKNLAEKLLRLHNKFELTASFTLPGDPKLLAGCTVTLKNWGAFDGKYIIKKAKHQLNKSGYNTQIDLRKVLVEEKKTAPAATEDLTKIAWSVIQGNWSVGAERRRLLTEAGYDYEAVQRKVNELLG